MLRRPDTARQVAASFCRKNEERSPRLFNNRNYRTATVHVSLCNAVDTSIEMGTDLSESDLFVKLEFERPPSTPNFLYSPQLMSSMFLTAHYERFLESDGPVEYRVTRSEVEPMQRWQPLFPVKTQQSCCGGSDGGYLQGTIYVCQKLFPDAWLSIFSDRRSGSAIYYGIRYNLEIDNDRLTGQSDVHVGRSIKRENFPRGVFRWTNGSVTGRLRNCPVKTWPIRNCRTSQIT